MFHTCNTRCRQGKYADCAKKGHGNKNCEIELELIEKAFFTHKHDAQYEKYKAESEARREKNLERFEKFDEDDKMEQCIDNNYVKYFSSNSLIPMSKLIFGLYFRSFLDDSIDA